MIANNEDGGGETAPAPKKRKGKKQEDLPTIICAGVEKPQDDELDAACEAYLKERDARMKLTPKEVEAKNKLMALMHSKSVTEYDYEERIVKLVSKGETLKVMKPEEPEDDVTVE